MIHVIVSNDCTLYRYARENLILLNVYIKDPYVRKFLTEEKITEINFVGTVGGIFGLFLGFSFMSVIDVIYFGFLSWVGVEKKKGKEVKKTNHIELRERCRHL